MENIYGPYKMVLIATPLLLSAVLLEELVALKKKKNISELQETVSNILCGLGQVIIEMPFKALLLIPYIFIYKKSWSFSGFESYFFALILTDFLHYWYHRIHHRVHVLWLIHLVHHQPKFYNFSVGLRLPWLHKLTVLPFYLVQAYLGVPPEVFVAMTSLHALFQLWTHTEVIEGKWGWLNYIFVTPSHHRVHHAKNKKYIDKNYAALFSSWDYLFGTFQREEERPSYGITSKIDHHEVWSAQFLPWIEFWNQLKTLNNMSERLKFIFMGPEKFYGQMRAHRLISHDENLEVEYLKWWFVAQLTLSFSYLLIIPLSSPALIFLGSVLVPLSYALPYVIAHKRIGYVY